jgi:hypothetical protein
METEMVIRGSDLLPFLDEIRRRQSRKVAVTLFIDDASDRCAMLSQVWQACHWLALRGAQPSLVIRRAVSARKDGHHRIRLTIVLNSRSQREGAYAGDSPEHQYELVA